MSVDEIIESKLNSMRDENYKYHGQYYIIDSWEITENFIKLSVNGNDKLSCPKTKFSEWIKDFVLSESDEQIKETENAIVIQDVRTTNTNLQQILYDTIEKVRTDPNYVAQAKAITNTTNCLLNAFKLELQLTNRLKKN